MSPILLGTFPSGSDAWHKARATRIGGSEAAAILGLSPYESKFSLYQRKVGNVPPKPENREMEWGNRLEAAVLQKWADSHGTIPAISKTSWISDTHPFMIANPDMMIDGEVVEAKTSPYGDGWGRTGSDDYPVGYRVQVIHYMHVLDAARGHLCVLVSGCDYREFTIERDAAFDADLDVILAAEQEFYDDLNNLRAPDIDDHYETYEAVKQMHPDIDDESAEIDDDLANAFLGIGQTCKQAEAKRTELRSRVVDAMGTAKYATNSTGDRVARRQSKDGAAPHLVAVTPKTTKEIKAA